jgi:hypothetical protein
MEGLGVNECSVGTDLKGAGGMLLKGEKEYSNKNLFQRHFIHQKSHTD